MQLTDIRHRSDGRLEPRPGFRPAARWASWAAFLLCAFTGLTPAWGELTTDNVGILANRNSEDSLAVARYYAEKRGIPARHIIELDLPDGETIAREDYEQRILHPIRQTLQERSLAVQIRVLVTTYGLPLRVASRRPTAQHQQWAADATERLSAARSRLEELEAMLERVAVREVNTNSAKPGGEPAATQPDEARFRRVAQAIREAARRLAVAPDAPRTKEWKKMLVDSTVSFGGLDAFLRNVHPMQPTDPSGEQNSLDKLRQLVASSPAMIGVLTDAPTDQNREKAYRLAELVFGLIGVVRVARLELDQLIGEDADASLDSELSLLWWDPEIYRLPGRTPNPLHRERLTGEPVSGPRLPVLMISRLDAPTPALARGMVDQALTAERQGLAGTVYLDAQGMADDVPFSTGFYDQSLRVAADLFQRRTSHHVVIENSERRFSNPGDAPDVAVYAGWYRLRAYEDAFAFKPGALGYHIASGEAISIHDPQETGWCKNALERGITVTLGSTGEPYLDAFPPPDEFLGLLLTGRYSLVEAYYLTTKFVSWRMVLFGDPLYNPWRHQPPVRTAELAFRSERSPAAIPIPPSEVPFPDPVQSLQDAAAWRENVLILIDPVIGKLSALNPKPVF